MNYANHRLVDGQICGAPDFIPTKKIPIGFIEVKNVGDSDLKGVKEKGNVEKSNY